MLKIQQNERKLKMFKFKKIFIMSLIFSLASFSNVLSEENLKVPEKKEQNVSVLNSEPSEKLDDNMKVLRNIKYIDFSNAEEEIPLEKEKAEQRVKQNMNLIYCCVNPFFKDRKDMSNFFAKSLFLNYVYDELIKELKKDRELEEYLNKKDEIISKGVRGEETNEEIIKIKLNRALLNDRLIGKESGSFFRIFLAAPPKIMQKIDDVFKSSERMKNIFNEKNFSDEKFEEIKNNAILFLEKEKSKIEKNLNDEGYYEQLRKENFKKSIYRFVRECYDCRTIESFKEAKLKELEYLKEKVANISNENIKKMTNDEIKNLQKNISTVENLQRYYEQEKNAVNLAQNSFYENLADDCLKFKKAIKEDFEDTKKFAEKRIEMINANIKAIRAVPKSDFEKVLTEVEIEKANELLAN